MTPSETKKLEDDVSDALKARNEMYGKYCTARALADNAIDLLRRRNRIDLEIEALLKSTAEPSG